MNMVHKYKGFTLIELLVVISIIGILAVILVANYSSIRERARDTQRKSDLAQYRTSLSQFASKNSGFYPQYITTRDVSPTICSAIGTTACPEDPLNNPPSIVRTYKYRSNGTASDGAPQATEFVLWAELEVSTTPTYWIVCSGGNSGESSSAPTSSVCPL